MKKLYLDMDGVLLTKKNTTTAEYSEEFIDFVTDNFDCYWLTTHFKGSSNTAIEYISKYFDAITIAKLLTIKPTNWTTLKTESIYFTSDFVWIDDNPFLTEIHILIENSKFDNLIIIDLNKSDELKRVMKILNEKIMS